MVRRARWWAALGALAMFVVGCSGDDGEAATGPAPEQGAACADSRASAKPAKRLTACLAPSVVLIEVGGSPMGSGVVTEVDGETYVVTNQHVVDPSPEADVVITGDDGDTIEAVAVIGVDVAADIAVLGPIDTERPPVDLAEPEVEKGDDVFLVGYPGETEPDPEVTISSGIVSRLRSDEVFDLDYVQTDASIGGGQSGGALADEHGRVIGISGASIAEEFALALDASDVVAAVERIVAGDGDEYWTFPSAEADAGVLAGEFELDGEVDVQSMMYESGEATSVEIAFEPADGIGIAVTDWDTGENVFTDRATFEAGMQKMGMELDPEMVEDIISEQDLQLGDPVAPGRFRFDLEADQRISIDVGQSVDELRSVRWTSTVPLLFQADDEVDVPLTIGEPHRGELGLMEMEATFVIDLTEGQELDVRVSSSAGDPGVVIRAPGQSYEDGWSADDNDVGLYGTDVEDTFEAEAAGQYSVAVENYGGAAMAYELEVTEAEG